MNLLRFTNRIRVLAVVLIPYAFATTAWGAPQTALDQARAAERELAATAAATDFDGDCPGGGAPPCDDVTNSLGKFLILVHPTHAPLFTGHPLWDGAVLTSPLLSDGDGPGTTIIGRSAPHLDGDATDATGTPVGSSGITVSDSMFSDVPTGFEGPAGTREVHTELRWLLLSDGSGAEVRAGDAMSVTRRSFGEVESLNIGDPVGDFPAQSFFNIFVEVTIPAYSLFPGATVTNSTALVVTNDNLLGFPPQVVYLHGDGDSPAVPVRFQSAGPGGLWAADDFFGWLILAGHGVGVEEYSF